MGKHISSKNIGDVLVREKLITEDQLETALKAQKTQDKSLPRTLVELGYITEGVKMSFLKKMFGYEIVSLQDMELDPIVLSVLPKEMAQKHFVVPIKFEGDALTVAMDDPSDIVLQDHLKEVVTRKIRPVIASHEDILYALGLYPKSSVSALAFEVKKGSQILRFIKYTSFPVLCFLPLGIFIVMLFQSPSFQNMMTQYTKFDIFLFTLLGWGLWAFVLYEIDGLLFHPEESEKKEEFGGG